MNAKRLVICAAFAVAAALPGSAFAQSQVTPPDADNYLSPVFMNDQTEAIPYNTPFGFTADTSAYTTQSDMFNPPSSGGPQEPTSCRNSNDVVSPYGNTIWSVFYTHHWGVMRIDTSGAFDSVIGLVPFRSPDNDPTPLLQYGTCFDELVGFKEALAQIVVPNQWYAVQVGGTGTPQGDRVQVTFELGKPPSVDGQAFLFWKTGPLRVSQLYVKSVPRGEKLVLSCTKGACKKKTINVRRKPVLNKMLPGPGSPAGSPDGIRMNGQFKRTKLVSWGNDLAPKSIAREAAKRVNILSNRKVKRGAKLELRITRPGFIGKYYRWDVKSSSITSATTRCMNPGSNTPRKRCNG